MAERFSRQLQDDALVGRLQRVSRGLIHSGGFPCETLLFWGIIGEAEPSGETLPCHFRRGGRRSRRDVCNRPGGSNSTGRPPSPRSGRAGRGAPPSGPASAGRTL